MMYFLCLSGLKKKQGQSDSSSNQDIASVLTTVDFLFSTGSCFNDSNEYDQVNFLQNILKVHGLCLFFLNQEICVILSWSSNSLNRFVSFIALRKRQKKKKISIDYSCFTYFFLLKK